MEDFSMVGTWMRWSIFWVLLSYMLRILHHAMDVGVSNFLFSYFRRGFFFHQYYRHWNLAFLITISICWVFPLPYPIDTKSGFSFHLLSPSFIPSSFLSLPVLSSFAFFSLIQSRQINPNYSWTQILYLGSSPRLGLSHIKFKDDLSQDNAPLIQPKSLIQRMVKL